MILLLAALTVGDPALDRCEAIVARYDAIYAAATVDLPEGMAMLLTEQDAAELDALAEAYDASGCP